MPPPRAPGTGAKSLAASPTRVHGEVASGPSASNTRVAACVSASPALGVFPEPSAALASGKRERLASRLERLARRDGARVGFGAPLEPNGSRRSRKPPPVLREPLGELKRENFQPRVRSRLLEHGLERLERGHGLSAVAHVGHHRVSVLAARRALEPANVLSSNPEDVWFRFRAFSFENKARSDAAVNPPSYEEPRPVPDRARRSAADRDAPDAVPSPGAFPRRLPRRNVRPARSTRSPSLPPSPLIERIGRISSISSTAARDTTVCLFGLFRADASLASILLCAIPPDIVYPVFAKTARARGARPRPAPARASETLASGRSAHVARGFQAGGETRGDIV